jgi:hypothetical protein
MIGVIIWERSNLLGKQDMISCTWMKHGLTKITAQIICGFRMMALMPQKKTSAKGKCLIVLHAGTWNEGLIDGCDLVFLAKSKDGDTGTCFIPKIYAPSSSLLQGKYLPFSPSPLRLNIFRLLMILSLTQLYCYTPDIFLFSTATFKYTYWAPLRRIGQECSANVAWYTFQSLKRIQPLPVRSKLI